jgi:dienelactone hydrolase
MIFRYLLALTLGAAFSFPVAAADFGTVEGVHREAIAIPIAQTKDGAPLWLEALVTRPSEPGRYPLALLSHGTPRVDDDRKKATPLFSTTVAIEFALRGWTVVSLMRRGYGLSQGEFSESTGPCDPQTDHLARARAMAQDIAAATKVMTGQPYIDGSKQLLLGVSSGGFASLAAAAAQPSGVLAVLNFGGGRGSTAPGTVCQPDRLVDAFGQLGKEVQAPTLWVYAENDSFFGPALAQRFFGAFRESGGKAQLVNLPVVGREGNSLFGGQAIGLWRGAVDKFLDAHGLQNWTQPMPIRPLTLLQPRATWDKNNVDEFERYRTSLAFEKAMAIGRDGRWVWRNGFRTPEAAAKAVLEQCEATIGGCRLYAINNTVAPR